MAPETSAIAREVLFELPDLRPASAQALQLTPDWNGEPVDRVCLFTDGSHFGTSFPRNVQLGLASFFWKEMPLIRPRLENSVFLVDA